MDHGGHGEHGGKPVWDLTEQIVGCAISVHSELGPGLLESTYCECLCHEIHRAGLRFEREKPIPVRYRGIALDCGYRADLIVEGQVLVELKAVETLLAIHEAQVLSYLKLSGLKVGLLLNFNVRHMKEGIRRLVNEVLRVLRVLRGEK